MCERKIFKDEDEQKIQDNETFMQIGKLNLTRSKKFGDPNFSFSLSKSQKSKSFKSSLMKIKYKFPFKLHNIT